MAETKTNILFVQFKSFGLFALQNVEPSASAMSDSHLFKQPMIPLRNSNVGPIMGGQSNVGIHAVLYQILSLILMHAFFSGADSSLAAHAL